MFTAAPPHTHTKKDAHTPTHANTHTHTPFNLIKRKMGCFKKILNLESALSREENYKKRGNYCKMSALVLFSSKKQLNFQNIISRRKNKKYFGANVNSSGERNPSQREAAADIFINRLRVLQKAKSCGSLGPRGTHSFPWNETRGQANMFDGEPRLSPRIRART